ncbi:MAG: pyridoxine 4-dehydrogenase [Solirubrobacteraceae bacterium]|nr:pyridoxine 4-dehydrogenase [Solirubrobacteraceae bacterium]
MPTATASGTFLLGGDLEVARLGFGAMRLTGPGITGRPADEDTARAVLRRAVELGVNHIDTADAYGPFVNEELIAEALHPYPENLVIATKGGLVRTGEGGDWPKDGRPEHLREACEGSLRRLRRERIDLYYLHRPDPEVPYEESIGALKELRDEGRIRHVAVSNVNMERLAIARGIVEIAAVQNQYSLTDRRSQAVLDECEKEGIGFVPWAPLDAGALEPGGPVDQIAERHGATPMQIALAWLLHASPAMLPIPGTGSIRHLEENVAAAEIELSAEDMRALDELAA